MIKTKHRINDVLHKLTSRLVLTQFEQGVKTLVIGDLNGYRDDNDQGRFRNQENHNWMYSKLTQMIRYKAERLGMTVELAKEYYTSKTCPMCLTRKYVSGRVYRCKNCGFEGHRDLVGSVNILSMYLGDGKAVIQVVAEMAPAMHVRFHPHMHVAHQQCYDKMLPLAA